MDNKKSVKLGDGVADKIKDNINENMSETLTMLSNIAFNYLKEKIKDIPQGIERILSSDEAQKEILTLWSNQLCERGLDLPHPDGPNSTKNSPFSTEKETFFKTGTLVSYDLFMSNFISDF